jgi:pimeloyl-ACP methyl ester carboxylesterase
MPDMAGPPVVLVHGCGGSPDAAFVRTGWIDAFKRAGRDPVLVDLPGHGAGTQSHDPASYADLARSLVARMPNGVIDAVGFSLGAKLLLEIAGREPQRIRRLVLGGLGDNAFAPEAIGEAAACALEHGATEQTPPPVRAFLDTWEPGRNDALAIAAVLRRPPNPVFDDEQLAALSLPILLVNGSEDPVGRSSDRLKGVLKNAAVRSLPGVGHFDLTAQPEFVRLAIDFLGHAGPSETGAHQ